MFLGGKLPQELCVQIKGQIITNAIMLGCLIIVTEECDRELDLI